MKNTTAILLIAVTITFGFFSCQKENEVELTTEEVMEPASFGIMHNKALSIFHQKFSSEKERNSLSLQDRITLFDQYLAEVVNEIEVGMLSQFVNNPENNIVFYLEALENSNNYIETGYFIISDLEEKGKINEIEKSHLLEINSVLEAGNDEPSNILLALSELEESLQNNPALTIEEKTHLLKVISISRSSFEYWLEDPLGLGSKSATWYQADAAGAYTATMTGIVKWASFFGPWAAAAALIGSAAIASSLPR